MLKHRLDPKDLSAFKAHRDAIQALEPGGSHFVAVRFPGDPMIQFSLWDATGEAFVPPKGLSVARHEQDGQEGLLYSVPAPAAGDLPPDTPQWSAP